MNTNKYVDFNERLYTKFFANYANLAEKKIFKKIDVKSARPHHFFRRPATLNELLNPTGLNNATL